MAEEKVAKIRIVSQGNSSRAAASRVYLDEQDITHLIRDVKLCFAGNPLRWHAALTLISTVDIDVTAEIEIEIESDTESKT